jgi:hypothetical protein
MKEKILLIVGCSNAAGSEIDGTIDSAYNRNHSFGNLLANKLGYRAINVASSGSANHTIARTTIEWINRYYNADTMDLSVLVAWTESSRLELPMDRETWYEQWDTAGDYVSNSARDFIRVNFGYKGGYPEEERVIARCQEFMSDNLCYLEIQAANVVLQIQYFLRSLNVPYLMCNTMNMFTNYKHLDSYLCHIDESCYLNLKDNDSCFYWKYRNAGYTNPKAKYWHHNETPHKLYSEDLYALYVNKYNVGT